MVAAELVETSRLFARTVARIDPETVEKLAEHLVKRQYSEPRWDAKRGSVVATERVTLYGLPLVVGRRVQYGSIDPVVSRELFIRHALVQGEWTTHHRFWADNQRAIEQVAALEERARRRDIRVDEETRVRALRRAHPGRRRLDPALRPLVEGRPPRQPGPAHLHARRCSPTPPRPGRCASRTIPTRCTSRRG